MLFCNIDQVWIYRIYLMKNMNEDCWLEFVWISLDFFYKFLYDEGSEENVVRQVVADEHLQTQHIRPGSYSDWSRRSLFY